MIVKRLVLHKCNRILFKDRTFEHDFNLGITTLIGTIGSGKSSIMLYTTPMITNHTDFGDGGYRELVMEHNDSTYIFSNHKEGKNHHSILKDGIEMNVGLKSKGYKDFISLEFPIDSQLWSVLLGVKTFTSATTRERKDWFNAISTVDYDFPIKVYNNISSSLRDYEGAKKFIIKNIDSIETKSISSISNIEMKIESLKELNNSLRKEYIPIDSGLKDHKHTIDRLTNKMNAIGNITNEMYLKANMNISELSQRLGNNKAKLENVINTLDSEENDLRIQKLTSKKESIVSKFNHGVSLDNIRNIIDYLKREGAGLEKALGVISKHSDLQMPNNQSDIVAWRDTLDKTIISNSSKLHNLTLEESNMMFFMSNYEDESKNKVSCPKCSNSFNPKLGKDDDDKYENYKNKIDNHRTQIDTLKNTIDSDKHIVSILDELIPAKAYLARQMEYQPIPIMSDHQLSLIRSNIHVTQEIIAIDDELRILENSKKTSTANSGVDLSSLISDLKNTITSIEKELATNRSLVSNYELITPIKNDLETIMNKQKLYEDSIKHLERNREIEIKIKENDVVLNNSIIELNSILNYVDRLNKLNDELREVNEKIVNLKLIQDALSPKKGLIAKSINGFIGLIVEKMNDTLKEILDYNLTILSPELENNMDTLDYNFPFIRDGDVTPIKDVRLMSTGQRELTDMAFLLVIHELLGLDTMLYLDEFGNRLDQHHRSKAMRFISELGGHNRQILMITHLKEGLIAGSNVDLIDIGKRD